MSQPKYRPLKFPVARVTLREGAGGVRYMKAEQQLDDPALVVDAVRDIVADSRAQAR